MLLKKLWKILCSRYFISSILIITELYILYVIEKYLIEYSFGISVIFYSLSFITLVYVINLDMSVEGKLPWVIVILLLQPFGALLFLMFGTKLLTKKEKKFYKHLVSNYKELFNVDPVYLNELKEEDKRAYQLAYALTFDTHSTLYKGSTSKYFKTGEDFFDEYLNDLKKAKEYIFIEYFIVSNGLMLDQILNVLESKVKDGVEVRFMYDDIGSLFNVDGSLIKRIKELNINVKCFGKYTGKANSSHNNRNHRKITIIDGKMAYTGGINIGDEYINEIVKYGYWKDSAIKIEGNAVNEFIKIFLYDWDLTSVETSIWSPYFKKENSEFDDGYYLPFGTGPKPLYTPNIAKNMYLNLINQAKEYIYLTTPYLIIDKELTNGLINAKKRGVDVKLILPHIPDKKIVYAVTKSSYFNLIKEGVEIYEFEKGFIHAKNFICDDLYGVCGTINFDYRSLIHHYENAVWMYKTASIVEMKEDFLATLNISLKQSKETAKQNFITRVFVSLISLFSPLF